MKKLTRRDFISTTASFMAACGITKVTGCSSSTDPSPTTPKSVPMPTRPFGKTGFNVSIFGLGGQAALETPGQEDLSEQIINKALELGVNYIDTSAYYGGELGEQGLSERNIGRVIKDRRDDVFLATKSLNRGYDGAMRDLEQSLQNLQTDYVDLWQIHNMRTQFDLNGILAPTGALRAFQQAKTEGTARFIGISGHYDPGVLVGAILSADFDAVLMALNAADVHYKSFIQTTLPFAVERDMAIVAMKIPARGHMFREGGLTTMKQALGYTLTHPVSTAIIGCSSVVDVEENVKLAKNFEPYSDDEMREIEGLTASYYRDAAWFKYEW